MPNLVSRCQSISGIPYTVAIETAGWSAGYTGYTEVALSPELFVINDNGDPRNMFERIVTKSCSLSVFMDNADVRDTFLDIINNPDGYYTIRITTGPFDDILFLGTVLSSVDEVDDEARPFFSLTAICGLAALKFVNYDEISTLAVFDNAKVILPINYVKVINFCLSKSPVYNRYSILLGSTVRRTFISSTKISEPFIGSDNPMDVMGIENIWVNKDKKTGFVKYANCQEVIAAVMTSLNMRMTVGFGLFVCISLDFMDEADRVLYVHYDDLSSEVLLGENDLWKKVVDVNWDNGIHLLPGGKRGYLPGLKDVRFNLVAENINVNYNHINREVFTSQDPYEYRKLSFVSQSSNFLFFNLYFMVTSDAVAAAYVRFEVQIQVNGQWVDGGDGVVHSRPGFLSAAGSISCIYSGSEASVIFETTLRDTDPVFNNVIYGHQKGILIRVPNNEDGIIFMRWRAIGVYDSNRVQITPAVIEWSSTKESRIIISELMTIDIPDFPSFDLFKNVVEKNYEIVAVNDLDYVTSHKEDFYLADANANLKNISLFRGSDKSLWTAGPGDYKMEGKSWTYKGTGEWSIEELVMNLMLSMQSKPTRYYNGSVHADKSNLFLPIYMQPHNTMIIRGDMTMILDGELVAGTDTYTGTFVSIAKVNVTPTFLRPEKPDEIAIYDNNVADNGFAGLVPSATNRQRLYKRFNPTGTTIEVKYYLVHPLDDYTFDSINASFQVLMTGVRARRRTDINQDADYTLEYDTATSLFTVTFKRAQLGKLVEVIIDNFFEYDNTVPI